MEVARLRNVELWRGLRDVLGVNDSCLTADDLAHNKDGMTVDLVSISYRLGDGQFRALQRYESRFVVLSGPHRFFIVF